MIARIGAFSANGELSAEAVAKVGTDSVIRDVVHAFKKSAEQRVG
jgi:hypothetical protein